MKQDQRATYFNAEGEYFGILTDRKYKARIAMTVWQQPAGDHLFTECRLSFFDLGNRIPANKRNLIRIERIVKATYEESTPPELKLDADEFRKVFVLKGDKLNHKDYSQSVKQVVLTLVQNGLISAEEPAVISYDFKRDDSNPNIVHMNAKVQYFIGGGFEPETATVTLQVDVSTPPTLEITNIRCGPDRAWYDRGVSTYRKKMNELLEQ